MGRHSLDDGQAKTFREILEEQKRKKEHAEPQLQDTTPEPKPVASSADGALERDIFDDLDFEVPAESHVEDGAPATQFGEYPAVTRQPEAPFDDVVLEDFGGFDDETETGGTDFVDVDGESDIFHDQVGTNDEPNPDMAGYIPLDEDDLNDILNPAPCDDPSDSEEPLWEYAPAPEHTPEPASNDELEEKTAASGKRKPLPPRKDTKDDDSTGDGDIASETTQVAYYVGICVAIVLFTAAIWAGLYFFKS